MCCLGPYRCLQSPEPAAPSAVLISVSVAKNSNCDWVFFWSKPPGFCAAPAHALVSMSVFYTLSLPGLELHHVDKPVCVGAALVIFTAVPGVLHSHPCQLGSAEAWRRAVLNECTLGNFFLTSCLLISQAASTLNQGYFGILAKLASEEALTWVAAGE